MCQLLVRYIPILKKSIECLQCQRQLHPPDIILTDEDDDEEDVEEDEVEEIELIPLDEVVNETDEEINEACNEETSPNEDTAISDRSESTKVETLSSPPSQPPVKRPKTKSTNNEGFQGVLETDALCKGCETVQYGNWIECERCRLWLCEECVPRQSRFQLRNISFNCDTCTRRQAQLRRTRISFFK